MIYFLQLYRKSLVGWLFWLGSGLIAQPVCAQISFRIVLDPDDITYRIYLTSTASYSGNQAIIPTAQVTLSVPHGTGSDRFVVINLTSAVPRMRWVQTDRADAPTENPDRDYLFFSFTNDATPLVRFPIVAGQDVLLFTFQRKGNCLGRADLMNNTADPFRTPNSLGINVGNSIALLGMRGDAYRDMKDPSPTVHIWVSTDTICAGQVLSLSAVLSTATSSTASAVAYTYQWSVDNQSMGPTTTTPGLSYTVTNPAATYTIRVRLTVASETPCRSPLITATQVVTVKPIPLASIQYRGSPCTPLPVDLSVSPVLGATYQWLRDTVALSGQTSPLLHVQESGQYVVRLEANGCQATSIPISVLGVEAGGQVTIHFPAIPPIVKGTQLLLDPQVRNAQTFSWSPADGLSSTSIRDPVATPTTTTTYTLTARSTQGCAMSDTVTVYVFPPLYIPTAFSPNRDGVNDTWVIRNTEAYGFCHVRVFDRWGSEVFSAAGSETPWDGKIHGKQATPGLYLYSIETSLAVYQGELIVL